MADVDGAVLTDAGVPTDAGNYLNRMYLDLVIERKEQADDLTSESNTTTSTSSDESECTISNNESDETQLSLSEKSDVESTTTLDDMLEEFLSMDWAAECECLYED